MGEKAIACVVEVGPCLGTTVHTRTLSRKWNCICSIMRDAILPE